MTVEDQLKELITSRYGTMKTFASKIGIANSTLATIMIRGVDKASISNIIKICKALGISSDELSNGRIAPASSEESDTKFKDINDITAYIKAVTHTAPCLTLNGKVLSEKDIELYTHLIETASDILQKSIDIKKQ